MTEQAFISIGSNIDPERNLPRCVDRLGIIGEVVAVSRVYQNPAVASTTQPDFLNAAVMIETTLAPSGIKRRLHDIETELGRVRTEDTHAARTIDLDLCLLGDRVERSAELTLPHPDIEKYAFVATPLAELAPEFVHPTLGVSLSELAARMAGAATLAPRSDVTLPLNASSGADRPRRSNGAGVVRTRGR